jgi:hypothetical protein
MRSPRTIGLLWAILGVLAILAIPRPDHDLLRLRDPNGFGDWFGSPDKVQPLYRTLKESSAAAWFGSPHKVQPLYRTLKESSTAPRRTWTVAPETRIALSFVGSDGELYPLELPASGKIVVDTRNLDLTHGTVLVRSPDDLGIPLLDVEVDILESSLGSAPREVGTSATGTARIRLRMGRVSIDLEGEFHVVRTAPNRLLVTVDHLPAIDLPQLGFAPAMEALARRFHVERLEREPSLELQLRLVAD